MRAMFEPDRNPLMMFGNGCPPWAFALPLNSPDFGTSRWQLRMEPYTNFWATE